MIEHKTLGKARTIATGLPYREWLAVRRMARARGVSPAALVREIIRWWMREVAEKEAA